MGSNPGYLLKYFLLYTLTGKEMVISHLCANQIGEQKNLKHKSLDLSGIYDTGGSSLTQEISSQTLWPKFANSAQIS